MSELDLREEEVIASDESWTVKRLGEAVELLSDVSYTVETPVDLPETFESSDELLAWLSEQDHPLTEDVQEWCTGEDGGGRS